MTLESLFPGLLKASTIFMQNVIQEHSWNTCLVQVTEIGLGGKEKKFRNRKLNEAWFLPEETSNLLGGDVIANTINLMTEFTY